MQWTGAGNAVRFQGFPINRVLGNQRKATGWRYSKMLTHFTMACTGNVSVPELNLTCLRELKTIGGTTRIYCVQRGYFSLLSPAAPASLARRALSRILSLSASRS